ncbi:formate hydrogenlyase complex iron-sulfur subunit [Raoultibacter phocaeensis]|uniref:formate hydrogenlyase complex iron-sulfur subunit n=1 Tax=Raoultibacter phocaeensis TaxID=2479841 RepID=UPI00111A2A82|nr:formate hydrogenlyase complex iron-sulfur subunit [Raoultibacter phocaeensis]
MLKTLKGILKTGDATVKYPFAPIEQAPDVRGKPEHDAVRCIACAACATACPPNAIQMKLDIGAGTLTWEINYGRCIFCGRCEEVCPVDAIRLGTEFELAVMSKDDLRDSCTYWLQKCSCCGEYFAPRKEVAYVASVLDGIKGSGASGDSVGLCLSCKQRNDALAYENRIGEGGNRG